MGGIKALKIITSTITITSSLLLYAVLALLFRTYAAEVAVDRFLYIGNTQSDAYLGLMQGLDESNLLGKFTGHHYQIDTTTIQDRGKNTPHDNYRAIFVAASKAELLKIANQRKDIPIINLTARDNNLRQYCLPHLFHISPSDDMVQDSITQWQEKHPNRDVNAKVWHFSFVKYAARDLNKRYAKAHGRPMNDESWAGWAAIKFIADALVRLGNTAADDALLRSLATHTFDGQKGNKLGFHENGQLHQLLLIIEKDKIVGEIFVQKQQISCAKPATLSGFADNLNGNGG